MELGIAAVCNARDPFRSNDAGHVFWRAAGYSRANFLDKFLDYAVRGQGNKEETVREPMEKLHIKTHQEALELIETAAKNLRTQPLQRWVSHEQEETNK